MRESLLLHSTNIVVYPNILLFMGLHYFISFAVFVVQFSRCVLNGCLLCNRRLVGTSGFEPPTSRLSGVRSNHLSYAPISSGGDQILQGQQPDAVLARDYIATFKLLGLYDIDQCWLCAASLRERGLQQGSNFVIDATALEPEDLRRELGNYDVILRF